MRKIFYTAVLLVSLFACTSQQVEEKDQEVANKESPELATEESEGPDPQVVLSGDSLLIRAMSISTGPFNLGDDPLAYLKGSGATIIAAAPEKNRHDENYVDTVYTLNSQGNEFRIYKATQAKKSLLLSAKILTDHYSTKHHIGVSMSKIEIIELLSKYRLSTIPRILILTDVMFEQSLTFEFAGDTLRRIDFGGYID